ncbi:YSIRK-type signal peptide-containing protein, partial [Streptococcus pyogenes]|uniref:YSIRK-type signal peptide-containing protein n=1 Tax=Streptococcus pyogenes TaxID=1314 RepID=UPI000F09FC95
MTRQQTKKNYSLRKLKTGTASVAVALTVLGAGFANQTTVKAEGAKIDWQEEYKKLDEDNAKLVEVVETTSLENEKLKSENEENKKNLDKLSKENQGKLEKLELDYLKKLDHEHKEHQKEQQEQEERQKNQEQLERKYQREVEKRYQEQLQKQQQLETEKQISDASRQGLSRDLEASRAAKKELEANHQKLEAE